MLCLEKSCTLHRMPLHLHHRRLMLHSQKQLLSLQILYSRLQSSGYAEHYPRCITCIPQTLPLCKPAYLRLQLILPIGRACPPEL